MSNYPFPAIAPPPRAALDAEARHITGQDFEALVARCRACTWLPHEQHASLRALVEVALEASAEPLPEDVALLDSL